jgi:hypothetical protein
VSRRNQFWLGCVGGLAVQALRWAVGASQDTSTPLPEFGGGFVAAVAVLILAGGLWNLVLEGHTLFLCVYHGGTASMGLSFLLHIAGPSAPPHASVETREHQGSQVDQPAAGKAELVLLQLGKRFGPLTAAVEQLVRTASNEELNGMAERMLQAGTQAEVLGK